MTRAIVSDLDGVIYRGNTLIPRIAETFAGWRARGLDWAFVTNNSRYGAAGVADKLTRLGLPTDKEQVVTAMETAADHVETHFRGARAVVIGTSLMEAEVAARGLDVTDGTEVDVVVLGFKPALSIPDLTRAVNALRGGARLVATNPDLVSPIEGGVEPCVGSFTALLTTAVPGVAPVFVGKPEPTMVLAALARLGVAPEDAVMVGDQPATDILAGQRAGLRSYLVRSGVHDGSPVAGIVPEGVIDTIADLPI